MFEAMAGNKLLLTILFCQANIAERNFNLLRCPENLLEEFA